MTVTPAPGWFRIVALVLLVWGAIGCFACVQQFRLGAEAMGPADDYQRALYAALPSWYNAVYAVATGTALLGAIALLARSALASPLFAISLAAVVVQFGWLFATTDIIAHRGALTVVPFPLVIAAIAAGSLWLAWHARARGWIG
ncbi:MULTISPECIES: hypothetical protein [unclassified Sphingomonas]|jgi:hypothetical protein|uniref:hypothetical protein n=1 Tax=unclassified Sphingomonas TaxID=196159 RepID=UPI000E10DF91|nr:MULTISPECIES: hypothetical protein [unclassified Sphingomonas]AXJ96280.1 hypothetical protein DM480_13010 [Sphingomonas sp. FARSPH]